MNDRSAVVTAASSALPVPARSDIRILVFPNWLVRTALFTSLTALVWLGWCWWRPPLPMLFLEHREMMDHPRQVSITIDDAPHPLTSPLLLAVLRRARVKATFFVIGQGLTCYPELTRRILADGHRLGNHSQFHHNLTRVPVAEYDREILDGFVSLHQAQAGSMQPEVRLFRPPGGGMNWEVLKYLHRHHLVLAWWSINVGDWAPQPASKIAFSVLANLRGRDVLLLHDATPSTAEAIPYIVKMARRRGYQFLPMPQP